VTDLLLHVTSSKLPAAEGLCVAVQKGRDEHIGVTDVSTASVDFDVPLSFDGDWRGPFVQGKKGERFLYLVWGPRTAGGLVGQVGRTKVMLEQAVAAAEEAVAKGGNTLVAELDLVDEKGKPRLARLKPQSVDWRAD
jgi:Family of unknown function (DUF5990)